MKYKEGDYEALHMKPVWQDRSDFIFAVHLGSADGKNEWEQLWGKEVGKNRYILCCIPFFAYDLALGDEVETDADHNFVRVIQASGDTTFRVWLGNQPADVRQQILSEVGEIGAIFEWSSENLLALSVNSSKKNALADYLFEMEKRGIIEYETGQTKGS